MSLALCSHCAQNFGDEHSIDSDSEEFPMMPPDVENHGRLQDT